MDIVISTSKKSDKKFDARIDNEKTVSFGQKRGTGFYKT